MNLRFVLEYPKRFLWPFEMSFGSFADFVEIECLQESLSVLENQHRITTLIDFRPPLSSRLTFLKNPTLCILIPFENLRLKRFCLDSRVTSDKLERTTFKSFQTTHQPIMKSVRTLSKGHDAVVKALYSWTWIRIAKCIEQFRKG